WAFPPSRSPTAQRAPARAVHVLRPKPLRFLLLSHWQLPGTSNSPILTVRSSAPSPETWGVAWWKHRRLTSRAYLKTEEPHRVNGTYCCENDLLLNQILRKEWGFEGFITSDFGAVHSTVASAMAGLDLEMPNGKYFADELKSAVQSGKVPVSVIDDKLIRRFRTMMRVGVFDHPPAVKDLPAQPNGATARRLAEEGIVLLKNDGGVLSLNA